MTRTFTVNNGSQSISFDAIPTQILGVPPFAIAAQSSALLPVSFVSNTVQVCTIADDLVMLLSAGMCSITASQGGNSSYPAATPVTRSFTVMQANPSGTLTQAAGSPITVGSNPLAAAVGNFHGGGLQDVAIVNQAGGTVTILLSNGSGVFTQAPGSPVAVGSLPRFAAAGDFNGDGLQDLAVVNQGSNNVTVLLGNGAGGFAPAPGSPFAVGSSSTSGLVGD